jgi:tetratricopeptide (TPR) repeat protein
LRAERARAEARAIADFLEKDILGGLAEVSWNNVAMVEALDQAVERLDTQFPNRPLVEASIRWQLGTMYSGMGEYRKALIQSERANEIRRKDSGREYSPNFLALRYARMGRYQEAEALFNRCFEGGRPSQADGTIPTAADWFAHCNLGGVYRSQGRYEEAEALLDQALACAVWKPEHKWRLYYSSHLASVYRGQGRYDEAARLYETILEAQCRAVNVGAGHLDTATSRAGLALVYMSQGRYDEAEPLLEKALQTTERAWGRKHPVTLQYVNQLGVLRAKQRRYEEGASLFKEALQEQQEKLGVDHPATLETISNLGALHREKEKYGEAEVWLHRALDGRRNRLGEDHPSCLETQHELGVLYLRQDRYGKAEGLLLKSFGGREERLGSEHPHTVESLKALVGLYEAWGKGEEAARWRAKLSGMGEARE